MTENSSAGSIVHNLEATLFLRIKFEPLLLFEIVDECLQKVSTRHLTGGIMVDRGNCTEHMLARYNDGFHGKERLTRSIQSVQAQGSQRPSSPS